MVAAGNGKGECECLAELAGAVFKDKVVLAGVKHRCLFLVRVAEVKVLQ